MKKLSLLILCLSVSGMAHVRCDEPDQTYLKEDLDKVQFVQILEDCSRQNKFAWDIAKGTTDCLIQKGFEKPKKTCLSCFSDTAACARQNCKWPCLWSQTEDCRSCVVGSCRPELRACTNLTVAELP